MFSLDPSVVGLVPPCTCWRKDTISITSSDHKLGRLSVQAGKKHKILAVRVQCICEAHYTVILSYCQQIHGPSMADATTSMENI